MARQTAQKTAENQIYFLLIGMDERTRPIERERRDLLETPVGELLRQDACRSRRCFSRADPFSLSVGLVGHDRLRHPLPLAFLFVGFHRAPRWKTTRTKHKQNNNVGGDSSKVGSVHVGVLESVFKAQAYICVMRFHSEY